MADDRTYTEREHIALLTDAVARETATLAAAKDELESGKAGLTTTVTTLEAEKADMASRLDVLEAEKAQLTTERDAAKKEFADFQAELAEKAAIEARKTDRVNRIKAAAQLPEDYFTPERAQRWAEMSDELFTVLLADIEGAAAMNPKAPHKFADGKSTGKCDVCGSAEKAQVHGNETAAVDSTEKSRETAAFTGGTPVRGTGGVSTFQQFMQATGNAPAARN